MTEHTVTQTLIRSPFGEEVRAVCICGWQTRVATLEESIDTIGAHIADTMGLPPEEARP